jgi:primosomal protein N' (replication factor Y) (superfamily II helicase)
VRSVTASTDVDAERRPRVEVVDWRLEPRARLSRQSIRALRDATAAGTYGVVLAARRGEGRAFVCSACGDRVVCPVCGSPPVVADRGLDCAGCGWRSSASPRCASCGAGTLVPLAAGAQRIARELRRAVDAPVAVLEGYDAPAPEPPAVLVMTRGGALDAPPGPVGAVVLPDLDALLRRPSLDAAEDALRLATTLAGWTRWGGTREGAVVVQTDDPDHHAIRALRVGDPDGFWAAEVALREPLRFPPVAHAIRLTTAVELDEMLRPLLPPGDELLGPVPTDGLHGYLVKCDDRAATLAALAPLRRRCSRDGVELRIDVDPVDAG